ncbi:MAG: carbohydrate-binding domain-containing protein [Lachnospiraceae bacterium]|nr:carbohydrate-binding domain-containing protein [Lachnospiraceae bacterium]
MRKMSKEKKHIIRTTAAGVCAVLIAAAAAGCGGIAGTASAGNTETAAVTAEETNKADTDTAAQASGSSADSGNAGSGESAAMASSDQFTERDLSTDYEIDCTVTLADGASSADGSGVSIDGDTVTITAEGTYLLTGSLSAGQIVIDVEDTEKVQLVLDGVNISNEGGAAIYVLNADKVFLTTAAGSANTITVTGEFPDEDEYGNGVDAAVFSKDDLTLNGEGALTVSCEAGHGIVSKNDLKVCGGTIGIVCAEKGLSAEDSVRIAAGAVTVESGEDGVHVENDDETVDAYFYMSGGSLAIAAGDDGIDAAGTLVIDAGTIDITQCEEGIEGLVIVINDGDISVVSADDGINASDGSGGEVMGMMAGASSGASLTINGGSIYVNSSGDALDSNGNLYVNGGTVYLDGPTSDGEGAIDIGDGAQGVITGGTLIAAGSSGMAENFGQSSTQGSILYSFGQQAAGTAVTLTDASGNVLAEYTPSKSFSSIVISVPGIEAGQTYTLTVGGQSYTVEMTGLIYGQGMMTGMGPGGMQDGQMPGQNGTADSGFGGQMPDGEMPDFGDGAASGSGPQGGPPSGQGPMGQ